MSVLSAVAKHEYYIEFASALPSPVLRDLPIRQRRIATAAETFEALRPGDAFEGRLAVQIVLTGAHAVECLREADAFGDDFAKRSRCRAQAASFMREERAAKRMLAQEQKVRLAVEAVAGSAPAQPAAASASADHGALQEAVTQVQAVAAPAPPAPVRAVAPVRPAAAQAARPEAVRSEAVRSPEAMRPEAVRSEAAPPPSAEAVAKAEAVPPAQAGPVPPPSPEAVAKAEAVPPAQAGPVPPPSPEAVAKAEAFAAEDIVAAAQIRHDGGVTSQNKAYLRHLTLPTDPALIDALVRGTSVRLKVLDEVGGETLDQAA
jgi:hypothetical protein